MKLKKIAIFLRELILIPGLYILILWFGHGTVNGWGCTDGEGHGPDADTLECQSSTKAKNEMRLDFAKTAAAISLPIFILSYLRRHRLEATLKRP